MRPGIVHRIDKDTSGLLMVAKNDLAHRCLAEQIKSTASPASMKRWWFAGCGTTPERWTRRSAGTPCSGKDGRYRKNSKRAVTHYEVLARYPGYTHIRVQLETGRTHQIQVHMAYLGHPVAGDTVYGEAVSRPD